LALTFFRLTNSGLHQLVRLGECLLRPVFFSELAGTTIRSPDFGFNNRDVLLLGELPRFRNSENVETKDGLAVAGGYRGSSLHNAEERGEDLTDFPGMFEPIIIAFSVAVVAHDLGEAPFSLSLTNFRASIKSGLLFIAI
jgi:hypothetical protein